MSDFESEHDTDSENEGQKTEATINIESTASTTSGDTELLDYYNEINNDKNEASLLLELQQRAGIIKQKPEEKKEKLEPWQQYLQERESSQSYTYKDPNDGTVYEWDEEKRAWFPKVFLTIFPKIYSYPY